MNVVSASSRISLDRAGSKQGDPSSSTTPLVNLYRDPPNVELSLDDFEVYALKRLKVGV